MSSKLSPLFFEQCNKVIYLNKRSDLTFIYISNIGKFLIDTDSSIINPKLSSQFYRNLFRRKLFNIQTAHAKYFHDKLAHIHIIYILNTPGFQTYFLFDFSPRCEGHWF